MSAMIDGEGETRTLVTRVDEDTHERVRIEAAKRDQSIAEFLRCCLDAELE